MSDMIFYQLQTGQTIPAMLSTPWAGSSIRCLLYTSDAADDLTRVDLGGRRIINWP